MKTSTLLWLLLVIVLSPHVVSATDNAAAYRFDKMINGQKISVVLEVGPFNAGAHRVKHVSISAGYRVDSERPIGNDGDTEARTEFRRFEVYWNDKKVPLQRRAYSAIFNVPLSPIERLGTNDRGFAIIPSIDGSSLLFHFRPNTGASEPEEAWLVVDRSGIWRKFHSWELGQ